MSGFTQPWICCQFRIFLFFSEWIPRVHIQSTGVQLANLFLYYPHVALSIGELVESFPWLRWQLGCPFHTQLCMALLLSKEIMLAKINYARKNFLTYRMKIFLSNFVISSTSFSSFSHKTNLCWIFSYMTGMDYVSERQDLGMGSNSLNS